MIKEIKNMKNKKRKIHIENEVWIYVVDTDRYRYANEIRIYSPTKQLYKVPVTQSDFGTVNIQPSTIKKYIINKIIIPTKFTEVINKLIIDKINGKDVDGELTPFTYKK